MEFGNLASGTLSGLDKVTKGGLRDESGSQVDRETTVYPLCHVGTQQEDRKLHRVIRTKSCWQLGLPDSITVRNTFVLLL